ncbi:MAG: SDR family NAD(P)-dependent oxidoreductase, partial [Candidatus Thermoplasmatota archaeon]|nr:SDR family NAD(P)-dependent oxidoreductase [Candidatus Thermoplasmatota archaeon]
MPEIGWDGTTRYRPVLRIIQPPSPDILDIEDGMNILIPGGGAGITAEIVKGLARKARVKMHLLGRTPLLDDIERLASLDEEGLKLEKERIKEEIRSGSEKFSPATFDRRYGRIVKAVTTYKLLADVKELGSEVFYHPVSVTDIEGVARIAKEMGPFDGVIHAAGVEKSKLAGGKKMADFDLVFDTKVIGAFSLIEATRDHPLKFFISFSSVAGRFGNAGQVDYSAANDLLDKMHGAVKELHPDCHVKAVGWSAWADVGMASKGSIKTLLEMGGVAFIPLEDGVNYAISEIISGDEREVFYAGNMGPLDTEGSMLWEEGVNIREEPSIKEEIPAEIETVEKGPACLIDEILEKKDGHIRVKRSLDGERERFLPDHEIMGKMVLPGVMGLEVFAETAGLLYPGLEVIGLKDVMYKKAVNVEGPTEVFVEGDLEAEDEDTKTVSLRLYSIIHTKRSKKTAEAEHYTARVILGTRKGECSRVLDHPVRPRNVIAQVLKDEIYKHLFHGDLFQVLNGMEILKDGELLGIYRPPPSGLLHPSTGWKNSDIETAPMQTECGFQAAGSYVLDRFKLMALPTRVGAIEYYNDIDPSDMGMAWVRFEGREENIFRFDVDFISSKGTE